MERTDYNGELRLKDVGKKVTLVGWVSTRGTSARSNSSISAITRASSNSRSRIRQQVPDVRNEYVIQVVGTVAKKDVPNPKLPTGEIEVLVRLAQP
jgi:aspartyl-tRNA synthetase